MSERENAGFRDDADLEQALRGLPDVEADDAFRTRLRDEFVSGSIVAAPRRRLRVLFRLGLAASVLAIAAGVLLFGRSGPDIEVLEVAGTGSLVIDGVEVPVTDRARLEALLVPGADVTVPPTARLDLVVPGVALFELTGGTRMTLPSSFGRWFPRDASGRLHHGEVRFASGPGFEGREMTLRTPEGTVAVTGTLLSVQCDEGGTCVCVLEGTVRVGVDDEDMEAIPPGQRTVMMRSGEVQISPVAPPHRDGVLDFVERTTGRFPRE